MQDFDYVGSAEPMIQEVECFRLMRDIFTGLRLEKVTFKFNHCRLLLLVLTIHGVTDEDYQKRVLKILAEMYSEVRIACVYTYICMYTIGQNV